MPDELTRLPPSDARTGSWSAARSRTRPVGRLAGTWLRTAVQDDVLHEWASYFPSSLPDDLGVVRARGRTK